MQLSMSLFMVVQLEMLVTVVMDESEPLGVPVVQLQQLEELLLVEDWYDSIMVLLMILTLLEIYSLQVVPVVPSVLGEMGVMALQVLRVEQMVYEILPQILHFVRAVLPMPEDS